MLNISSIFKRKKLAAVTRLAEITEQEARATRNAAENDAHVDKQITQLSAKLGTSAKGARRLEMVIPSGYQGKDAAKAPAAVADTQAASVVAAVKSGVEALRAENSDLKARIQNLETSQAEKAKPTPAPDMVKLAAAIFPMEASVLKRTCDASQLAHKCERLFHLSSLGGLFPSINFDQHRVEVGEPKPLHGLARATHAKLKAATLKALGATL